MTYDLFIVYRNGIPYILGVNAGRTRSFCLNVGGFIPGRMLELEHAKLIRYN